MSKLDKLSAFFNKQPESLSPALEVLDRLRRRYGNPPCTVLKTRIKVGKGRGFCWLWLPICKSAAEPEPYFLLSFELQRACRHPRILGTAHPAPDRWIFHTALRRAEDLDDALFAWLDEAYTLKYRSSPTSKGWAGSNI